MIKKYLEHEVQCLLARGKFSLRSIARQTGVSRGTIANIANGTRKIKSEEYRDLPLFSPEDEFDPLIYTYPPKRCDVCGYVVYLPCRICAARQKAAAAGIKHEKELLDPDPKRTAIILGLNLKPVHQQRYEEVRRWLRENRFAGSIDGSVDRVAGDGQQLISLENAAKLVHRSKRTLEKFTHKMPEPKQKNRRGVAYLWAWSELRPFLIKVFRLSILPDKLPWKYAGSLTAAEGNSENSSIKAPATGKLCRID